MMKRYNFYCSYDGGGIGEEIEEPHGDHVRFEDAEAAIAAAVAAEREQQVKLRKAAEYALHQLEGARIWSGMGWHYNPLHPLKYLSALERLQDVLRT